MPYATNLGTRIYWEEHGRGEPVLAIMGLSFPLEMWHRTAPVLSRKFRVILFDNRGVGRSDVPRGPYLIRRMASDAARVLDAAGIQSAHVMGASMGGMIAQEFALHWPERVRSLLLGCTWCGGLRAVRPDLRFLREMHDYQNLTPEQKMRALIPLLYTPTTPRERIDEDIALRMRHAPTARGYYSQLAGTLLWNSWGRLPKIKQPVKILHGELDRLIPVANAAVLASRIRDSRTAIIPGAGHVFTTDATEVSNFEARTFLEEMCDRYSENKNGQFAYAPARTENRISLE
jgi:pimeloyl-ACP methyl ester carboxylesterase